MPPSFVSVIALQSSWAAAMEAGEVSTAQRRKQLLSSENPAPAPQASLAAAQEGFVPPQCLTRVFHVPRGPTWGQIFTPTSACGTPFYWVMIALVKAGGSDDEFL